MSVESLLLLHTFPEHVLRCRDRRQFLSPSTLCVIDIGPWHSEKDLFRLAWALSDAIDAMERDDLTVAPPVIVLSGFSKDPRELWHIPQARALLGSVVSSGMLSVMEPSALISDRLLPLAMSCMGAMECWLIATDRFECDLNQLELDPETTMEFLRVVLPDANQKLFDRIARVRGRKGGKR
jgi:hypothetical protein